MINITARNFKLTEGIKSSIFDRLGVFEDFLTEDELINVVLQTNKYGKKVEVDFKVNGKPIRTSCTDNDLYVAINLISEKIDTLIRKYSKKMKSNNGESIRFAKYPNLNKNQDAINNGPGIVKRKYISSKPMLEEEAIAQMELLNYRSFLFYNASTDAICMLYKRNDGHYGIIEAS